MTNKESKNNQLHKEFGLWSNIIYILRKTRRYSFGLILLIIIGFISDSIITFFWGFISKYIIDIVGADLGHDESMYRLLLVVIIGTVIIGLAILGTTYSIGKRGYRMIHVRYQLIAERISKALDLPYELLERPDILDIHERAAKATQNSDNGIEGMLHLMVRLFSNLLTVIVTFVAVTILDARVIFILVALAILQYIYHRYCIRKDKEEVWNKRAKVDRQINYMERVTRDFDYAKDIRLFNLSDYLVGKQKGFFRARLKKIDYHFHLWFSHAAVNNVLSMLGRMAIYGALFYAVFNKDLSVGNFTLFLSLAISFSRSLLEFLHRLGDCTRASLEVDDFRSFMELDFEDNTKKTAIAETGEYTIEFHDVSFKYSNSQKYALEHLNLVIRPGERLAVVGINGAGKTTMIKLLLRLYDPTEGYIMLNGTDIRDFNRAEYYRLFAPVFQNIEVMAFPIAENISMKMTAETDLVRAYDCVAQAGLRERIDLLENGINTELLKIVDENGVDFSGGERQKLALARALYKDAPVVVLDEPTSALDAIAEQKLYESFDRMIGHKSAVYISHRLSSVRFCNRVAMFKNGRMIEYGSHEELMQKKGEYAQMFEIQARYYQDDPKCKDTEQNDEVSEYINSDAKVYGREVEED